MSLILYGKPVADSIYENLTPRVELLKSKSISASLAVLRIGGDSSFDAYLRGIHSASKRIGVSVHVIDLPHDISAHDLKAEIRSLNLNADIKGILPLRPLPASLKHAESDILNTIDPSKDVDCATDVSTAALYLDQGNSFYPCTAEACVALMDYYGIACAGKHVVIIGRSAVIGKPLALMLLGRKYNATVTVCHSRTENLKSFTRCADIIISAAGHKGLLTDECVRKGQILLDVSVNFDADKGRTCGDADFESVEPVVDAITPVPKGIGAVTSAILMKHIVVAAERYIP